MLKKVAVSLPNGAVGKRKLPLTHQTTTRLSAITESNWMLSEYQGKSHVCLFSSFSS